MLDQLLAYFQTQFVTNEIFSGALLAGIGLGLLNECKRLPSILFTLWTKKFVTSLSIDNEDELFPSLQQIIHDTDFYKNNRTFRMVSKIRYGTEGGLCGDGNSKERHATIFLIPYNDTYFFRYKGRWVKVSSERSDKSTGDSYNPKIIERFTISYIGTSSDLMNEFCIQMKEIFESEHREALNVYMYNRYSWEKTNTLNRKSPESIVLPTAQHQRIFKSIQQFEGNRSWYTERSIPYHFGIMFYGAPGTGKTSLVHAIASETGRDVYYLSVGKGDARSNSDLMTMIGELGDNAILLIEDIDHDLAPKTFSGLLNSLDGMLAKDGLIVIMTTNNIDKIPDSLIRPGRIDLVEHISECDEHQIKELYKRFIVGGDADEFYKALPDANIVPASLQVYFMEHDTPETALKNIEELRVT